MPQPFKIRSLNSWTTMRLQSSHRLVRGRLRLSAGDYGQLTTSTLPMSVSSTTAVTLIHWNLNTAYRFANQIAGRASCPSQLAGAPFNGSFILQPNTTTTPNTMESGCPRESIFSDADDAATLQSGACRGRRNAEPASNLASILRVRRQRQSDCDRVPRFPPDFRIDRDRQDGNGNPVELQPTLLAESSTVTNPLYRGYVSVPGTSYYDPGRRSAILAVPNQTIAKIRLVP